ncbi:hypothetical protein ABVK25_011670 [Lepraria finkii]|uniref:Uncharacterized protein n=1 Tax=Lepraria finkii TaxID=1340010 RepID=A0ABR4AMC4_9LECA
MAPLTTYLSALLARDSSLQPQSLHARSDSLQPQSLHARSDSLSPLQSATHEYLATRDTAKPPTPAWNPGSGAIDPTQVNNHAFFALFALLGVAIVLGVIWFFFWARNGGFRWRGRKDWEDYKSTVLRRKGPNGTTLSGATKTTRLGGGSVVNGGGKDSEKGFKRGEQGVRGGKGKVPRGNRNNDDQDMRAYRHEKPARVGGLNRESDGIFNQDFAYSDNTYSDVGFSDNTSQQGIHVPINTSRAKKTAGKKNEPTTPSPKKKNNFYNQTPNPTTQPLPTAPSVLMHNRQVELARPHAQGNTLQPKAT